MDTSSRPLLMRFILTFGKWLGLEAVPQEYLRVIYRMDVYYAARGPGLIRYNRLSEELGPLVYVGPFMGEYVLNDLMTRDNLRVSTRLGLTLRYDPRIAPARAPQLLRMMRPQRESVVESFIHGAAMAVINKYSADQLTQQTLRARIEQELSAVLADDIKFLGFKLVEPERVRLVSVDLPARLVERHELLAQRRLNILGSSEFLPEDLRRALVIEVLERLGQSGGAQTYLSFNEALEGYLLENPTKYARFIEAPSPHNAPRPTETPPAPEPSPPDDPKPRRPRSRLD